MHAALLGIGLVSLSAPRSFDVSDVEALPVDIVPVEELTQIQEGDKKAPMAEKPAPKPTQRPDTVLDAKKIGDNEIDTENPVTPEPKPKPVKTAEAAAPAPTPFEKPKPEEVQKPKEEPKPTPATEVAPVPAPKQEVKPEPVKQAEPKPEPVKPTEPTPVEKPAEKVTTTASVKPDAIAETIADEQEKPAEQEVQLPSAAPAPEARPRPAEAQTAKAPDRKDADKPVKEAASKPKSDDQGVLDEVAAVLNKDKASGGGAKRSTQEAALGGKKSTGGAKLSQSEMDALRAAIQQCWNVPAGAADAENLRVSVKFKLTPTGELDGRPEIIEGGGAAGIERAAAESARRAVMKCAPYNLPSDKYEGGWDEVTVNFDPTDMF